MNRLTQLDQETFDELIRGTDDTLVHYRRKSAGKIHADGGEDTEGNPIPLCFRYGQRFGAQMAPSETALKRGYRESWKPGSAKFDRKAMEVYPPGYRGWCRYCIDAFLRDHPELLPDGVEYAENDLWRREEVEASSASMVTEEEAWVPSDSLLRRRFAAGETGIHTDGGRDE